LECREEVDVRLMGEIAGIEDVGEGEMDFGLMEKLLNE
jgi:hypothetical protein